LITVPFNKIPVKPQLYRDYIAGNPRLLRFYSGYYRNPDDLKRIGAKVVQHDYQRPLLVEVLREINQSYGLTPAIEANLELLKYEDTVTIITGQQAGLYTGPLYTILKAISTLKIASRLSKLLNRPVVPLFWIESSDHDLAEVNHIFFPAAQGPQEFTFGKSENPNQQSVGSIKFGKDFEQFSDRIKKTLAKNDFYDAVIRLMDETYYPGVTYSEAFGKMMSRLLGRFGLIMVDAESAKLKRLASPIIIRKIQDKGRMNELILEQSQALEKADFKRQIQIRTELLNIFILKDNNRVPINVLGEVLGNGENGNLLDNKALLQIAQENPERFSPKVAFRPIVQDFLFPTVVYVGGPSELAYFAQLKTAYEFFNIQMPIIWPRTSASIIDNKIYRHIQKTNIQFTEIFRDYDEVLREILIRHLETNPDEIFASAEEKLTAIIDWLMQSLEKIDHSLIEQMDNPSKKMLYQLQSVKNKTISALKIKEDNMVKSWEIIRSFVFPNKKLQERVYNVLYFLSRHGFWLMDYIMDNLDTDLDEHQILNVPT